MWKSLSTLFSRPSKTQTSPPMMLGRWCHKQYMPTCDQELKAYWAARDNSLDTRDPRILSISKKSPREEIVPWEHPTLLCYAGDTFGH